MADKKEKRKSVAVSEGLIKRIKKHCAEKDIFVKDFVESARS